MEIKMFGNVARTTIRVQDIFNAQRMEEQGAINQRIGVVNGENHGYLSAVISHTYVGAQNGYNQLDERLKQLEMAKDTSSAKKPHLENANQPKKNQGGPSGNGPPRQPPWGRTVDRNTCSDYDCLSEDEDYINNIQKMQDNLIRNWNEKNHIKA